MSARRIVGWLNFYRWLRRMRLVPNGLHSLLLALRNTRQTITYSDDIMNEINLIRLALLEVKDELRQKEAEIAQLHTIIDEACMRDADRSTSA